MSPLRTRILTETPRRLLAAGSIALVLLLSVLASDAGLHRQIHGHSDADHEDGCAVVLFAHGTSVPFDSAVLAATPDTWLSLSRPESVDIFLASPRYLHQPERGPPVS